MVGLGSRDGATHITNDGWKLERFENRAADARVVHGLDRHVLLRSWDTRKSAQLYEPEAPARGQSAPAEEQSRKDNRLAGVANQLSCASRHS
jgi:hypothetical protein